MSIPTASGTTPFLPMWPRVYRARSPGWTSPSLTSSPGLSEEPDGPLKTLGSSPVMTTPPTGKGGLEELQLVPSILRMPQEGRGNLSCHCP